MADFVADLPGAMSQWDEGPQLDEIAPASQPSDSTGLVTLSVGGNDTGFPFVMDACVDGFLHWTGDKGCLAGLYGMIHQRAPQAEIRVLRDQIWLKLVGNVAFNPITALTGATLGQLGTLPAMRDLLRALFAESAAVAARLGVTFPVSLGRRLEAGIEVGDHKTSMLQDLEAGKRLEHECMTGAIVELAARLGVDVPHTSTVHACVQLLDRLRAERADHR